MLIRKMDPLLLFMIGIGILHEISALPASNVHPEDDLYKVENCIQMSPEKEEQINSIALKVSDYLYNLTLQYDDLDIRVVKIVVDSHSENESEEKVTEVELVVNDCANINDLVVTDFVNKVAVSGSQDKQRNTRAKSLNAREDKNENTDRVKSDKVVSVDTVKSDNKELIKRNPDANQDSDESPKVLLLDLDENGNKLLDIYEEKNGKKPLLLYVQKVLDNLQYLFLN